MLNTIDFDDELNDDINIFIDFDDNNVPKKMIMVFLNSLLILTKIFINN